MGAPFDKVATYEMMACPVMQLFFLYKVYSDDTDTAAAVHPKTLYSMHIASLLLGGAIAATDFLAASSSSSETEEPMPEDNTTDSNSTDTTTDPTDGGYYGYYWAR